MISKLKSKFREFLRWQVAVGSQSQAILDELRSTREEQRRLLDDLEGLRSRLELGVRLQANAHDIMSDSVANWRREADYQLFLLKAIEERVVRSPFAYLGNHIGIATTAAGFRLYIDTRDRQIAPHLATVGIWEPWNTAILKSLLKPGDHVVEVGANFGFFTILSGHLVGNAGRVIAFEANPAIGRLLEISVEINGLAERVDCRSIAVADAPGEVEFAVYDAFMGNGHLHSLHQARNPGMSILSVPADTLDRQVKENLNLRLLRLDAEGAEPAILRGARSLIARSHRLVILMEWGLNTAGQTAELNALQREGFGFYIVCEDGSLRPSSVEELAQRSLCDVLLYRGDVTEFAPLAAR